MEKKRSAIHTITRDTTCTTYNESSKFFTFILSFMFYFFAVFEKLKSPTKDVLSLAMQGIG